MQGKDNENSSRNILLDAAHKQLLIYEFDELTMRIKLMKLAIAKHINRQRVITRLIGCCSHIPLRLSDTERMDRAMQQAMAENNPLVEHIQNCHQTITLQDKVIYERDAEIQHLQDEISRLKNKNL